MMFEILHDGMVEDLNKNGRREPTFALEFWKSINDTVGLVSPLPLNRIAKAAWSAQASLACSERVFGDLGRMEGR